ncbi:MAG TPA: 16S rRNA (guanine(527)-N(7))-methyltransferase RsmG [Caulobacteraceae bacterium]
MQAVFEPSPQTPAAFQEAIGASDVQRADVEAYLALLTEWNRKMNLVGPSALAEFWPRHAYDSAQLLRFAPEARAWADLGAGAGFPGLVLAILLKGQPGAKIHLVESMAKRCRFLAEVAAQLALPVEIHNARAEDLGIRVDIVTARACAPLHRLLGYAEPYLKRGATGLFLKGQDVVSELTEAAKYWKFGAELSASSSHPDGRILQVKGLSRVRKV